MSESSGIMKPLNSWQKLCQAVFRYTWLVVSYHLCCSVPGNRRETLYLLSVIMSECWILFWAKGLIGNCSLLENSVQFCSCTATHLPTTFPKPVCFTSASYFFVFHWEIPLRSSKCLVADWRTGDACGLCTQFLHSFLPIYLAAKKSCF